MKVDTHQPNTPTLIFAIPASLPLRPPLNPAPSSCINTDQAFPEDPKFQPRYYQS